MSYLSVYKASAGSGKTYTMALTFMKQLLGNESAYRRILAVTFTNKATGEMKQRIVHMLSEAVSDAGSSVMDNLIRSLRQDIEDGRPVPSRVRRWLGMPDAECRKIMRKSLETSLYLLLHDYSRFSVMTIDTFFQRIIRSFAREFGLEAGYVVELDTQRVLEQAVDRMFSQKEMDRALFDWLMDFAAKKIEEGGNWNLKGAMMKLASALFKEHTQSMDHQTLAKLTDKHFLNDYRKRLRSVVKETEDELKNLAQKALDIMQRHQLSRLDFAYGERGFANYFQKTVQGTVETPSDRVLKACDDESVWYTRNTSEEVKSRIRAAYPEMNGCLARMISTWSDRSESYYTARAVLQELDTLGVLSDIRRAVDDYCREQGLFLLADSNAWLNRIIDGSDAPFIYERIGAFYDHYMIDEMQDTSGMQWQNFRPLLLNGISNGKESWMVGDIKQAIYRFRNSDWRIMAQRIYEDIGRVRDRTLKQNWRSEVRIIQFNNQFVKQLVQKACREFCALFNLPAEDRPFGAIYDDVEQEIPEHRQDTARGYVEVRCYDNRGQQKKSGAESDRLTWEERVLQDLPAQLITLQQHGYAARDIAILVRRKEEANRVVDTLARYRKDHPDSPYVFDVLYNESLYIDDSPVVRWMVGALVYLLEPSDAVNTAFIRSECEYLFGQDPEELMPEIDAWRRRCLDVSVYEALDQLIGCLAIFERFKNESPYIQSFMDVVSDFGRTQTVDVRSFVTWWEDHPRSCILSKPESQQAISVMTIHKSKGLEFPAVVLPFASWPLHSGRDVVWLKTQGEPFDALPVVPVLLSEKLLETRFAGQYQDEERRVYIDQLNLLYVALTRAVSCLMISLPADAEAQSTGSWMKGATDNMTLDGWNCRQVTDNPLYEDGVYTYGELPEASSACGETEAAYRLEALFQPVSRTDTSHVTYIRRNQQFFEDTSSLSPVQQGIILHDLFSGIRDVRDVPACLQALASEGRIAEADQEHLSEVVCQALHHPEVQSWFRPDAEVMTEAEILLPGGIQYRPDRVVMADGTVKVIDYKFGTQIDPAHQDQVRTYMQCLHQMGYAQVEGFLWYMRLNRIVPVAYAREM